MELIKDTLLVLGRIGTILPLLLFLTLFMGKRSIGELPVFDFLVTIILGSVVGADIAEPDIEHFHIATAIIAIALLQKLISKLTLKYRKIGKALTFEPTIVIQNGIFLIENMRKIHYSLDNVLQMLREKDVFDVSTVELGIIEANGNISVYKKEANAPPTRGDLGVVGKSKDLAYPVIIEGKVEQQMLPILGVSEAWLLNQLEQKGIKKTDDVFFASLTKDLVLHLSPQNRNSPDYLEH